MSYRPYGPPTPSLIGYDPCYCLPQDHLARLVEEVVEACIAPEVRIRTAGQPPFDPRLCVKVLVYAYATGVRSSRQMEKNCCESLPYLYLTRGDTPSYRTLCNTRVSGKKLIETVWISMFAAADGVGLKRIGRIVVDTTKLRANTSQEMVLKRGEYGAIKEELEKILAESSAVDVREDAEGYEGETRTGKKIDKCQMRDIVRSVRKRLAGNNNEDGAAVVDGEDKKAKSPAKKITKQMLSRVKEAISAIDEAESDGRGHLSLTDPDARMMQGGVEKKVRESHSLEIAIDKDSGLIVAEGATQISSDNERLMPLVEAAKKNEPNGIKEVDGDSGFYKSSAIAKLINDGIDTCIPDSITAGELHRGLPIGTLTGNGKISFTYDEQNDVYLCPNGNTLKFKEMKDARGEQAKRYMATQDCRGCQLYGECIASRTGKTKHKSIIRRECSEELIAARMRFDEPEHRHRYHMRGWQVESPFGFIRGALGYQRWLLRGSERVNCEEKLIVLGYQVRTVHRQWACTMA